MTSYTFYFSYIWPGTTASGSMTLTWSSILSPINKIPYGMVFWTWNGWILPFSKIVTTTPMWIWFIIFTHFSIIMTIHMMAPIQIPSTSLASAFQIPSAFGINKSIYSTLVVQKTHLVLFFEIITCIFGDHIFKIAREGLIW